MNILLLLCLSFISSSYISLHFDTLIGNLTSSNIKNILPYNYIYTSICVGSPSQCFNLNIELQNPLLSIIGSSYNSSSYPKYDSSKSSTYKEGEYKTFKRSEPAPLEGEIVIFNFAGYESTDTLTIADKTISNISFINVDKNFISDNLKVNSGILGLDLRLSEGVSKEMMLINQLKKNNVIDDDVFYIEYKDEHKGNLIIGEYPHKVSSSFKEENAKETYAYTFLNEVFWGINFNSIKLNNSEIEYDFKVSMFSIESGFILAPNPVLTQLNKTFFKDYIEKGFCKEEAGDFESFSCEDTNNVNFESFPTLSFYHKEINITFSFDYSDLFYKFEGRRYCLIFGNYDPFLDTYWILGKPFFIKYKTFFRPDSKRIGFYEIEPSKPFNFWWILLLVASLIIIGLLIYIVVFVLTKKRKKRAIELDDDYEYIPKLNV